MTSSWDESRRAFGDAAAWFVRTAALVAGRWDAPGLGEWDVRALVGHTSRSLSTVEAYLARPAPVVEVGSAAEYFRAVSAAAAAPGVAQRGREAGEALGADPASAVAGLAARVLDLVAARTGEEVVTTFAGGMRLADYLPTRTVELSVHTADLAAALDLPADAVGDVPASAARQALHLVADLAVERGLAGALLRVATGRPAPISGLSVL
ncbi:maleylpyruvate isomerase N-terminal domain-containing protein [Kineococcus terrestris]|uniref:maleylpyruvate isomerase N-terminal domain-containing protein n=1 Tax=Kineococcus terrestris TaxID=2044856 RepID=UPI0034DB21A5